MIRIYTSRLSQSTVWVNSISSNNAPAKPPSALLPSQSPQFALTKPDKFVPTVQSTHAIFRLFFGIAFILKKYCN